MQLFACGVGVVAVLTTTLPHASPESIRCTSCTVVFLLLSISVVQLVVSVTVLATALVNVFVVLSGVFDCTF